MEQKIKKNSDAKIKANNKYSAKTYKRLQVSIRPGEYTLIDEFCKNNGISKASFIFNSCKYCIDKNIIFSDNDNK